MTMTIAAAFANWNAEIKPEVIAQYGRDDFPALSESWNDYTDSLTKDGELNALQYHYCPAWDDEIPSDDAEFIAEAMGVTMGVRSILERSDNSEQWDAGASHWAVTIKRGANTLATEYSQGSAHTGEPEMADVLGCLLSDGASIDGNDFEEWAADMGMDTDSRRAFAMFEACQETARQLGEMFTASELDDLRELFADR